MSAFKSKVLALLYGGTTTIEEFHWENLVAPPIATFLTPTDIGDLHETATSIRWSGDINKKYNIIDTIMKRRDFARLAGGTNRIAYRHYDYSSIVSKVAIDREGVKNNPDELFTQNYIKPFCTKVFETTPCGTVGMFERVERITSRLEFASIAEDVYNMITTVLVGKYVLEDIGTQFMYNWGIRRGFGPVLLDFPYIYELDGTKITCFAQLEDGNICGGEIDYDAGFNFLTCTKCGTQYRARDLAKELKRPYSGGFIHAGTKGEVKMKVSTSYGDQVIKEVDYKDVTQVVRKPKVIKYQRKKVTGENISHTPKAIGSDRGEQKSDLRKRYNQIVKEEKKAQAEAEQAQPKAKHNWEMKGSAGYVYVSTVPGPNGMMEVTNTNKNPIDANFVPADATEEQVTPPTTVTEQQEKEEQKPADVNVNESGIEEAIAKVQEQIAEATGVPEDLMTGAVGEPECGYFSGTCEECREQNGLPFRHCCLDMCANPANEDDSDCRNCPHNLNKKEDGESPVVYSSGPAGGTPVIDTATDTIIPKSEEPAQDMEDKKPYRPKMNVSPSRRTAKFDVDFK